MEKDDSNSVNDNRNSSLDTKTKIRYPKKIALFAVLLLCINVPIFVIFTSKGHCLFNDCPSEVNVKKPNERDEHLQRADIDDILSPKHKQIHELQKVTDDIAYGRAINDSLFDVSLIKNMLGSNKSDEIFAINTTSKALLEYWVNLIKKGTIDEDFTYAYNKKIYENELIDESLDPCDDFYKYACGSAEPTRLQSFQEKNKYWDYLMKDAMNESLGFNITGYRQFRQFYMKCIDEEVQYPDISDEQLVAAIDAIGGWHIQDGWKLDNWDSRKVVEIFMKEEYLPIMDIIVNQQRFPTTVADHYFVVNSNRDLETRRGDQFVRTIKKFHKAYSRITNTSLNLDESYYEGLYKNTYGNHIVEPKDYINVSLDIIKSFLPNVNWNNYVDFKLSGIVLTEEQKSQLEFDIQYSDLLSYGNLLNPPKSRELNDYLIYNFILTFVNSLSNNFRPEYGTTKREDVCWSEANWNFPMVTSRVFSHILTKSEHPKMYPKSWYKVQNISELMREKVKDHIKNSVWMNATSTSYLQYQYSIMKYEDTFNNLENIIASEIETMNHVPEYNNSDTYFNNVKTLRYHTVRNMNYIYAHSNNLMSTAMQLSWRTIINKFSMITDTFKIITDQGLYGFPVYEPRFNYKFLHYGLIGSFIGHEYIHNSQIIEHISKLQQGTFTSKYLTEAATCLIKDLHKYVYNGEPLRVAETLDETIADIIGIKLAFEIYKELEAESPSDEFRGHEKDKDRHFFLSHAQAKCQGSEITKNDEYLNHPPGPIRINAALSHNPYFHETFQCPLGSPMHPAQCKPL